MGTVLLYSQNRKQFIDGLWRLEKKRGTLTPCSISSNDKQSRWGKNERKLCIRKKLLNYAVEFYT